ncbi:helix-turn-helix domain-containing protein [Streptomyces sp. NPDC048483]|uniref:helix-turn-helix domain-containing protein n=1 Tax=Streptomyces sp. NPDC048483 TaxID=3154927 RepID=UPI00342DEFB7
MASGTGATERAQLAELLEELKERSGRTYTALAHRTGLSRSTLHRYCQGTTVPGSFSAVERVARVCGARPAELDRLYRLWSRASVEAVEGAEAAEEDPAGEVTDEPGTEDAPAAPPTPERGSAPAPRPVRSRLGAGALLLALVVTAVAGAVLYWGSGDKGARGKSGTNSASAGSGSAGGATAGQRPKGPLWSITARPVPPEFFGVTLNTDTGAMPGFRTGAVRLWESETRWGSIEPRRRHYDWSVLDRMVEAAEQKGLPVLFTVSGTPLWAAPGGRKSGYSDSLASPPDDLADWDHFVAEAVTRYRDRIESYELWDYPSHPLHYSGSIATLAEMVKRAARIIRRDDPGALVVCPSFGQLWSGRGQALLRTFARTGAYESCDAAALKLPPRTAGGQPEEIIELARKVQSILYEEGQGRIVLWNTGPDRDIAVTPPLDARHARDYAVRFYLAGLYSRHYMVRRMYFYSWGSTGVPLVIQPVGGPPTEAGLRIGRLQQWLDRARIAACGRGAQMGLAQAAYTCRFERGGARLVVAWTSRGRAEMSVHEGAYRLRHMDGRTVRVRAGDRISFGQEPVLIEHRAG